MIELEKLKTLLTDNQICVILPACKVPDEIRELSPESEGFIICPSGHEFNEDFKQSSITFENLTIWYDELDKKKG